MQRVHKSKGVYLPGQSTSLWVC